MFIICIARLADGLQLVIVTCRLLASKQAEQQNVLTKEARSKQMKLQQQRQQHATKRFQASQDGPGDLRPDGQRYRPQNPHAAVVVIVCILSLKHSAFCSAAHSPTACHAHATHHAHTAYHAHAAQALWSGC